MNKKAIIACGALYGEVNELLLSRNDWDIVFLPQGLHDKPNSSTMRRRIQDKIDELEGRSDYDRIVLGYGLCGGGVEGLSTSGSKLVVPKVHDCIPLLAGNENLKGNMAEPGTYYLSRGWIDCSSDAYKEHLFFSNQLEDWRSRFLDYKNDAKESILVNNVGWWFNKERLDPEKRERGKFDRETSRKITLQCIGNYRTLALIENNLLETIHTDYANRMYEFLSELFTGAGKRDIELKRLSASLDPLKEVLFHPSTSGLTHIQPANKPLEIEEKI
ncbi:MAG: DUF1638 domain-containing protein [Candidatus Bipolaricaulota bacterium]|nr:DUF1638 domain-containing protein [Candidatus Bipolaricaulota bacterium]